MSAVTVTVHKTKMLYATILKALALWEQIRFRREILSDMLPDISTQWDIFTRVVSPGIARQVAITASLSKSANVPDETRVPPSINLTDDTLRFMHRLAGTMGLTLNTTDYTWLDEETQLKKAYAAWTSVIGAYLEIEQLVNDLTMHRAYGCDMYQEGVEQRTPGQLTFYSECNIPLSDGIFAGELSRPGLQAGFGDLYMGWLMMSVPALLMEIPPAIETTLVEVTASADDDPNNPGVKTQYGFGAPGGWSLGGVILAATPDLEGPEVFYTDMLTGDPTAANTTGIYYATASSGKLYVMGDFADPAMPAEVAFKLLLMRNTP